MNPSNNPVGFEINPEPRPNFFNVAQTTQPQTFLGRLTNVVIGLLGMWLMLIFCSWLFFREPEILGFLPSQNYIDHIWWVFGLVTVWQIAAYKFSKKRISADLEQRLPFRRKQPPMVVKILGVLILSWMFSAFSLPVTYYLMLRQPPVATLPATFTYFAAKSGKGKICSTELHTNLDNHWFLPVCVSRKFADSLRPGQQLQLVGKQDPTVGFWITEIKVDPKLPLLKVSDRSLQLFQQNRAGTAVGSKDVNALK